MKIRSLGVPGTSVLLIISLSCAGCSSGSDGATPMAAGGMGMAQGGTAGSTSDVVATAGVAGGGAGGSQNAAGGMAGSVAQSGAGGDSLGGGGAGGEAQGEEGFECSQFMGPNVTGEWFAAGFEDHVDGAKWQVKAPHRSFVEDWADPNHAVWREENCDGTFFDCDTRSTCEGDPGPDRVLFVTQTGDYLGTSQDAWEALIESAVPTLKSKYPNLKHIELLTFLRSPDGQNCGTETTVSENLDNAQIAVAERSDGFISVGPRFAVDDCGRFGGTPHLNADGNAYVANMIGEHYANE